MIEIGLWATEKMNLLACIYTCDSEVQEFQSVVIFFFESEFYSGMNSVNVLNIGGKFEIRIIFVDQENSIIHIAFVVDDFGWREWRIGFNMVVDKKY